MEESNVAFAGYLQAYTAASVQLLRRWPTFVPDEERLQMCLSRHCRRERGL